MESSQQPSSPLKQSRRRNLMPENLAGLLACAGGMLNTTDAELVEAEHAYDDASPSLAGVEAALSSSPSILSSKPFGSIFLPSPLADSAEGGGESFSRIKSLLVQMQYQRKSFCEEAIVQYQVLEKRLCQVTRCNTDYSSNFEEIKRTLDSLMKDRQLIEVEMKQYESKIDSVEEATNRVVCDYTQYVREEREWKESMEAQLNEIKKQATSHLPDVLREHSLNRSLNAGSPSPAAQATSVNFKSNSLNTIPESSESNRTSHTSADCIDGEDEELLHRLESSYVDATTTEAFSDTEKKADRRKARRLTKLFCSDCEKWKALLQSYFRSEEMGAQKIDQLEREKRTLEDVILSAKKSTLSNCDHHNTNNSLLQSGENGFKAVNSPIVAAGAKRQILKDYSIALDNTYPPADVSGISSIYLSTPQQRVTLRARSAAVQTEKNGNNFNNSGHSDRSGNGKRRSATPSPSPATSSRKKYRKTAAVETNTDAASFANAETQYDAACGGAPLDADAEDSQSNLRYSVTPTNNIIIEEKETQTDNISISTQQKLSVDSESEALLPTENEIKLRQMLLESDEQNIDLLSIAKNSKETIGKLEANIDRLNNDLLQRNTEIERFQTLCLQLDTEQTTIVDRFTDKLGRTQQLENKLKQMNSQWFESEKQLRSVRQQLGEMTEKRMQLETQLNAERVNATYAKRMKLDVERKLELSQSKEAYSTKAQQQLESQCKQYLSDLSALRDQFQTVEVENNTNNARLKSLSTKCSYYETLMKEQQREHDKLHKQLREQLAEQSAEGEQQLQELSRQQDDRSTLQTKISEFMEQMDVGQRQLSVTRNELSLTSKLLASQKLDCYRAERDAEVFKMKLAHLEERSDRLEVTLAAVRAENEREVASLRTQKDNLAAVNQDLLRQLAVERQKGVIDKLKESIIGTPSSSASGGGSKQQNAVEVGHGQARGSGLSPHQQKKTAVSATSPASLGQTLPSSTLKRQWKTSEAKYYLQNVTATIANKADNENSRVVAVRRSASNREMSMRQYNDDDVSDGGATVVQHGATLNGHYYSSVSQTNVANALEQQIRAQSSVILSAGNERAEFDESSKAKFSRSDKPAASYFRNYINEPDTPSVASFAGDAGKNFADANDSSLAAPRSILKKTTTTTVTNKLDAESLSQVPQVSLRSPLRGVSGSANEDRCSVSSYSTTLDGFFSECEQ